VAGAGDSVRDGEALPDVSRLFDFIDHRDRIVFERDPAFAAAVGQQPLSSGAVSTGALAGHKVRRRAEKRPVQRRFRPQGVEKRGDPERPVLPGGGEVRLVDQALTGSDLEAARPADDDQTLDLRARRPR
jgi:hypothetical protein